MWKTNVHATAYVCGMLHQRWEEAPCPSQQLASFARYSRNSSCSASAGQQAGRKAQSSTTRQSLSIHRSAWVSTVATRRLLNCDLQVANDKLFLLDRTILHTAGQATAMQHTTPARFIFSRAGARSGNTCLCNLTGQPPRPTTLTAVTNSTCNPSDAHV